MKKQVDKSWTLLLDRDGVINKKINNDYVKNIKEFEFEEGVLDLFPLLNQNFGKVIVVTNQQGIGKKLMTVNDLHTIHSYMIAEIEKAGGKIDHVYFAPNKTSENSVTRKPGIGMPLKAAKDFPDIIFERTVMVGDSPTDIEMGKKIGAYNIFLHQGRLSLINDVNADANIKNLSEINKIIDLQQ